MKRYETMAIVQPDLADDQRASLFERMKEIISQQGGSLMEFDDWGVRHLAYEIKKKKRGYYVRLDYCGTGAAVTEIERFFRIDDRVMKYMTILLSEKADPEAIMAELAAKKAKPVRTADEGSSPAAAFDEAESEDEDDAEYEGDEDDDSKINDEEDK
ncbi:MAG: 30S ribosomal protein S6 [Desulfococcaceae bacterium]